jgi:hypothetical protein
MNRIVRTAAATIVAAAVSAGCAREPAGLEIQTGTDVTLEKTDGVTVDGRLVEVQAKEVVLERADGQRTRVPRSEIRALRAVTGSTPAAGAAPPPAPPAAPAPPEAGQQASREADKSAPPTPPQPVGVQAARGEAARAPLEKEAAAPRLPEYREVQIPAGTVLPIELRTTVGSATSHVEDQVRGRLRRSITIDGVEVIPAGAEVLGTVIEAERSGRVKGRARVAFRFARLDLPGEAERIAIRTGVIAREAEATKKQDAAKIGGGAAAGAVIGGILGGGDGAAKGAAIGGGAGTGVVLSTRGKEVSVPVGTSVSAKLLEPVTIRVRVR